MPNNANMALFSPALSNSVTKRIYQGIADQLPEDAASFTCGKDAYHTIMCEFRLAQEEEKKHKFYTAIIDSGGNMSKSQFLELYHP